uniref:Uncharacterized protein n=1 Tax=Opuntia streptacantha TaxID=393608 RepID=A0A7C8ZHJ9_OPUST
MKSLRLTFLRKGTPSMLIFTILLLFAEASSMPLLRYKRTGGHPTTTTAFVFIASSSPVGSISPENTLFLFSLIFSSLSPGRPSLSSVISNSTPSFSIFFSYIIIHNWNLVRRNCKCRFGFPSLFSFVLFPVGLVQVKEKEGERQG